jgi:hypothetical protein
MQSHQVCTCENPKIDEANRRTQSIKEKQKGNRYFATRCLVCGKELVVEVI